MLCKASWVTTTVKNNLQRIFFLLGEVFLQGIFFLGIFFHRIGMLSIEKNLDLLSLPMRLW